MDAVARAQKAASNLWTVRSMLAEMNNVCDSGFDGIGYTFCRIDRKERQRLFFVSAVALRRMPEQALGPLEAYKAEDWAPVIRYCFEFGVSRQPQLSTEIFRAEASIGVVIAELAPVIADVPIFSRRLMSRELRKVLIREATVASHSILRKVYGDFAASSRH